MKTINLCWWGTETPIPLWNLGECRGFQPDRPEVLSRLYAWLAQSQADFVLFWWSGFPLPAESYWQNLVQEELDLAHAGLKLGVGEFWPDLQMVMQDWSMINLPKGVSGNSWRVNWRAFLVRRDLWLKMGGLDQAFVSLDAAVLVFGYRCLRLGARVEYRPEMLADRAQITLPEPAIGDMYVFLLRTYGSLWGRYVLARRLVSFWCWRAELKAWREAVRRVAAIPEPSKSPVWYEPDPPDLPRSRNTPVTVIIPTLGRYPYLPGALMSLRNQTVQPREVIVVDQNPPEQRQPQTYKGYEDLHLRVIWQDERGQSLARNTGLAAVTCPYVLLFDDDSIAYDDLIEAHLRVVVSNQSRISTGVSYPPSSNEFQLPPQFQYFRLAQTFDTGNSLLPITAARQLGGLDRNYDFGPGTDVDFGTRLYLAGLRIIHNPQARRIHFKAPVGGLRLHSVVKYNTDQGLLHPFPPVTQTYYGQRYLTGFQRRERALLQFVTSKFPRELRSRQGQTTEKWAAFAVFVIGFLLLPLKYYLASRKARVLIKQGARLATFEPTSGSSVRGES